MSAVSSATANWSTFACIVIDFGVVRFGGASDPSSATAGASTGGVAAGGSVDAETEPSTLQAQRTRTAASETQRFTMTPERTPTHRGVLYATRLAARSPEGGSDASPCRSTSAVVRAHADGHRRVSSAPSSGRRKVTQVDCEPARMKATSSLSVDNFGRRSPGADSSPNASGANTLQEHHEEHRIILYAEPPGGRSVAGFSMRSGIAEVMQEVVRIHRWAMSTFGIMRYTLQVGSDTWVCWGPQQIAKILSDLRAQGRCQFLSQRPHRPNNRARIRPARVHTG